MSIYLRPGMRTVLSVYSNGTSVNHGLSSGYFYGLVLRKTRNADVALKSSPINVAFHWSNQYLKYVSVP